MSFDLDKATEHLDTALDHLLALRLALGVADQVPEVPEALDNALGQDDRASDARREVRRLLDALGVNGDDADRKAACMALEEAVNGLVALSLDVGFTFGWRVARGGR